MALYPVFASVCLPPEALLAAGALARARVELRGLGLVFYGILVANSFANSFTAVAPLQNGFWTSLLLGRLATDVIG